MDDKNIIDKLISFLKDLEKQIWIIEKVKQVEKLSNDVNKYSKLTEC